MKDYMILIIFFELIRDMNYCGAYCMRIMYAMAFIIYLFII